MEVHRLSTANDELPELHKKLKILEEKQQTHNATVSQMEVREREVWVGECGWREESVC